MIEICALHLDVVTGIPQSQDRTVDVRQNGLFNWKNSVFLILVMFQNKGRGSGRPHGHHPGYVPGIETHTTLKLSRIYNCLLSKPCLPKQKEKTTK